MNSISGRRLLTLGLLFAFLHIPVKASACAVCMGDPSSREAGAINAAMFLMLGFIGSVLSLLCAFGIHLYRRSQTAIPPHLQLAEIIGSQSK